MEKLEKLKSKGEIIMKSRNWRKWFEKAGIRAVKTIAQAAIAGIGTAAAMGQVDWKYVLSASALAGVLSLFTSVAGLPELDEAKSEVPDQDEAED